MGHPHFGETRSVWRVVLLSRNALYSVLNALNANLGVGMGVDILSDVLGRVRLTGAVVFRIDVTGCWGVAAHSSVEALAPAFPPGTNNVIAFHIVIDGRCWLRGPDREWIEARTGDAFVLPRGDPHELADRPGRPTLPMVRLLGGRSPLELRRERFGTPSAPSVSLVCGFLGCNRRAFEPLCSCLPSLFRVDLGARVPALVGYAATQALDEVPGAAGLRARLAELLFMEALRRYMEVLPEGSCGWLAGARDPLVGRALRCLHGAPGRAWSVTALARESASSRSRLAGRFRIIMGESPMRYLMQLRMQLAANYLSEQAGSLATIAKDVGYDSNAAFQRAFKRHFGVPPAAWRRRCTASGVQPEGSTSRADRDSDWMKPRREHHGSQSGLDTPARRS